MRCVIGRSVDRRPIWAIRRGGARAAVKVVFLGQMHGNERAGVRTADYLIRRLPVPRGVQVWIVPTMNPDGRARDTRQNARGVDLNRNWPMNWHPGPRNGNYPGRRAASEPETRAMVRFLRRVRPQYVVSVHQPFDEVGYEPDKPAGFQRRLAHALQLPLRRLPITGDRHGITIRATKARLQPGGRNNSPTLTGWYNANFPGTALTVEYAAAPSTHFVTVGVASALQRVLSPRPER